MKMKTPIVLLHGALGDASQLQPIADALLPGPCLLPDMPGHGTLAGEAFSMDDMVEALHAALLLTGWHKPAVFGYSMGGYIALLHEARYPGYFSAIVTLGTKLAWSPAFAEQEQRVLQAEFLLTKAPELADTLKQRHGALWEQVLSHTAHMMASLGQDPPITGEMLQQVENPVVLGLGERDKMVSVDETTWAADHLRFGRMEILPGVRHPIEQVSLDVLIPWLRSTLQVEV
jgi:pimeloyl-ACP methyl ester carboxylesterase